MGVDSYSPLVKTSTQLGGIASLALLAPVKPGFVPGAEGFTYARRLEVLFKTVNAIRMASREASRAPNPFPDSVGRWGLLHSFRYALIPPQVGTDNGLPGDPVAPDAYRLYLNVTFDGGWEPYLRVIYRDIGLLLDTIFSNCQGYLSSSAHSYEDYIRWVRSREVPAGTFFVESAKSVLDQRYLEEVERIQRNEPDAQRARQVITALSLKPPLDVEPALAQYARSDAESRLETSTNNLRALKGLYDLRACYADNADGDGQCLLRFAKSVLPEFSVLAKRLKENPAVKEYHLAIDWLLSTPAALAALPRRVLVQEPDQIQTGIRSPYVGVTHGCLFLLAVTDEEKARDFIATLPLTTEDQTRAPPGGLHCNVAFTRQGLQALKIGIRQAGDRDDGDLARFPQEFIDGMEARAGLLGDVRGNHPDVWRRPRYKGKEVDLRSVHIVLQYRLVTKEHDPERGLPGLHSELKKLEQTLTPARGLRLLSSEAMRSYPTGANHITREHFGFQDGFSQPKLAAPTAGLAWDDAVADGELFLGHGNDRGDGPYPRDPDPLLDNGSFLVIRKLRQDVAAWQQVRRAAAAAHDPLFDLRPKAEQAAVLNGLAAKMMGRTADGDNLVDPARGTSNNFNFKDDQAGLRCPFQSHVRRANPRTPTGDNSTQNKVPRLVRRGMSYGPRWEDDPLSPDRGLYFMAYCGNIAEQFEIIQRWIAGGNSSGVLSSHSDPLLGVPQKGQPRSMQWLDAAGQVVRVDLGDKPLVTLEWGLYLFVPSRDGLAEICRKPEDRKPSKAVLPAPTALASVAEPDDLAAEPDSPHSDEFQRWRRLIQDPESRDCAWHQVRDNQPPGDLQTPYGRLVSDLPTALTVLQDPGTGHSVCGFGRRFSSSIGPGYLGMDKVGANDGHDKLAEQSGVNAVIESIDERRACQDATAVTQVLLQSIAPAGTTSAVDLISLSERAIAALCSRWFGLPDEKHMFTGTSAVGFSAEPGSAANDPAHCPRDFVFVARHIFGPHPTRLERRRGIERGRAIQRAIKAYLGSGALLPQPAQQIRDGLIAQRQDSDTVAHTLAGVMLGFGPSTHGNYANIMRKWVEPQPDDTPTVWDVQTWLLDADVPGRGYDALREVLRPPLMRQMRKGVVPATVWREAPGSVPVSGQEPAKVVIGLHGLAMNPAVPDVMMFGGARPGSTAYQELQTVHACPGYGMAVGTLLGIISTLLLAGTLKATPSPTILNLVR